MTDPNPRITLTTFIDFLVAPSSSRLRIVRQAKDLYLRDYEPYSDYWKQLRERIVEMHENGEPPQVLDQFLASLRNGRKFENYANCVAAYKKWLGRKSANWIGTAAVDWEGPGLVVRVNPELGLELNGNRHSIKLYFRAEKLSAFRAQSTLGLLSLAMPQNDGGRLRAILDVRNGKLHTATSSREDVARTLEVEAIAFREFWNRL